jgi:hypothetical protein
MKECKHDVSDKYVTTAGLVCRECLPADVFVRYPCFKVILDRYAKRREIAIKNFGRKGKQ